MDLRSIKTGVFELPVVVICRHSLHLQPKLSWSSTIRVAVQYVQQDDPHECLLAEASDSCLCIGILPPPQLSKDVQYAKGLIDQNKGIVEVGAGWPACERKSLRLHIVWHDAKALLESASRSKGQQTNPATLKFVLLIGARFVEAFSIYQQRRDLLMSLSILPCNEQQVAHEIKLLLVHIMKSLQNRIEFNSSLTQKDVEERVLVNIMNILVDVQLADDKKAIEMSSSLLESGDQVVSGEYLRILKHKVRSELVVLLQHVLAFSKDSLDHSRLDEREEGAWERVSYMRRAVLDIIELLKHTSQAGDLCTETYLEGGLSSSTSFNFMGKHEARGREKLNKCTQEQMLQIQWKLLLAVLEKKDSVSLENILRSIRDGDMRRLLKFMAWPLGLVCYEELHEGDEKLDEELMKRGALTSTGCIIKADLGGHRPGALRANIGASGGYYVKSSDTLFEPSLFQEMREPEKHSYGEGTKQGDVLTSDGASRTDNACQSVRANEPGGHPNCKFFEQHAKERRVQGLEAGGQLESQEHTLLKEHAKESHLQGQGAGGQSECQEHAPIQNKTHGIGQDLDMDTDPSHASVLHDSGDSDVESPSETHQLQAHDTHDADPSQVSGDLQLTNQAVLENAVDSHVPSDHTCSYAASSSPLIASSDNDGDDDFHDDVEVSKARRRKRRNRKPHRAKEIQDWPCPPHSRLRRSQLSNRKIWLAVTMAFIFGATVIGIFWFQSDFSSNQRSQESKTFARGYLP